MKTRRRLNKVGKAVVFFLICILVLICFLFLFKSRYRKNEIHILKTGDTYQLKINYPVLHQKIVDSKIKEYVVSQQNKFLQAIGTLGNSDHENKYDLIIQYQLNREHNQYHIYLETYVYIGGENYIKDNKAFHYDKKGKKFLDITDYLNQENDLEKLSSLSYYYIMEYSEKDQNQFDESVVKKTITSNATNFEYFKFKEDGIEILFSKNQIVDWPYHEVQILIPYRDINDLLKKTYQGKTEKVKSEIVVPKNRDLNVYKNKKLIAFTFDDGPSNKTTNRLLDGLKDYDAKVTFFVLGNRVEENQTVLKRAYQEGHVIGSHTYNHRNLLLLNDYARLQEIKQTNNVIEQMIGIKPILLRPPYGNINGDIKKLSNMHTIQWNIDTEDWKYKDKERIANEIVENAHDGAIVLLHDIYDSSVEGALLAMKRLQEENYAFVTILEMAQLKNIKLDYTTSYSHLP